MIVTCVRSNESIKLITQCDYLLSLLTEREKLALGQLLTLDKFRSVHHGCVRSCRILMTSLPSFKQWLQLRPTTRLSLNLVQKLNSTIRLRLDRATTIRRPTTKSDVHFSSSRRMVSK